MSAKIAMALHEVMSRVGYVQKTGKNAFHGYKYAGEAAVLAVLRPAMVEAGLILIPTVTEVGEPDTFGNVTIRVEYSLVHKDGDVWPEKVVAYGVGNDYSPKSGRIGDKGYYKALTGANKYLLFKLFQLETGDDPEQASSHDSEDGPTAGEARQTAAQRQQQRATARSMERAAGAPIDDVPHDPETGEIPQELDLLAPSESEAVKDEMLAKLEKIAKNPSKATLQLWARTNGPLKNRLQAEHKKDVELVFNALKVALKTAEQQPMTQEAAE